ncbi:TonB-linked SusC/RagA family outer membrane protein [Anseongella ginsenosidimutans]|uniref:TonB-linked SusC/RagA family outer membrane protein n=1 Tax=Anseongella ginsenosidimutans TaxID=496056 RepID=A0A4R3KYM7_9SPHI|nr:SusC/RagA family TonB-linked outer membrane protein [Anseongella ginsenosidimutans]TCS90414.1 TonB-linked SusC/RagA family outer membrane protein [Anseongella ginsenosidimutans]
MRYRNTTLYKWAAIWLFVLILPASGKLWAQELREVTGTVTDSLSQTPVPGVSVQVKGTNKGVQTDLDGNFSIQVSPENVLVFSFLGYATKEIRVGSQSVINAALSQSLSTLDQVVVIGYGTLEKSEVTSSVTSLTAEDIIPGMSNNPLRSLQGKVSGLNIASENGTDPNAGTSIQLRGANSVNASQGPLVVIDGVPGADINSVARDDIKSIDILKDASAGAIYGTRASGGVILITTKSAQAGPLSVSYSGELSTETTRRKAEVLSAEEFVAAGLGDDLGHRTDWFDEVTRDFPFNQRHTLTLRGGSESAKIYASLYSNNAQGIGIGSKREEFGGRLNTHFSLFDGKAEIISHASYSSADADFTNNGIYNMALKLNPTETPYDATDITGYNVWTGGWEYYNPVADINLRTDQNQYKYLLADVRLKVNITDNLNTSAMVATKNNTEHPTYWRSAQHKTSRDQGVDGYAKQEYKKWFDQTFEWLVNYNNQFGDHSVKAVGGYSFQQFNGQGFWAENSDFPVDGLEEHDLNTGSFLTDGRANMDSWKDPRERLIAFFGRVNYSFKDRYLLSASFRREGSSKFAPGNRWGSFPAISAGWRISEEPFMSSLAFVDDLKIRGGYGVTGNEGFDPGVAMRMYGADTWWLVNGEWVRTYGLAHNQNVNLQWETKKEYNIGLDFSLFDYKLTGKIDVYERNSDNLIYDISVPQPPAIHNKTTMNVGSLRNRGVEVDLTWNAINKSDLNYSTTVKMSHNRNTLVSLWGSQTFWDRKSFPAPGSPGSAVRLYPGRDIGSFFIWKFAGFTEEGNWMLYDKDGNAFDVSERSKSIDDKQFIGNAIPDVILSWNHSLEWRNFDLNVYMRGWFGHDVFNMINMYYSLPNVTGQNVLKSAFEEHRNITGEKELSDYWLEKGDFVKLDAVTLGYTFNTKAIKHVKNLRVYLTGRDLFTITGYSGLNPEVNINGLEPGFEELSVYPQTRSFTLGVQANF